MKKTILLFSSFLFTLLPMQGQSLRSHCYRGHADVGYSIGVGDYEFGRFEVNTAHGYQFNPFFFLGAGAGIHFMASYSTSGSTIALDQRESTTDIPLFANMRWDMINKRFSPFIDCKGGYFVTNNGGLYMNVAVGCKYVINEKIAIHLSAGYTREELEFETFDKFVGHENFDYYTSPRKLDAEAVSLKLGLDF